MNSSAARSFLLLVFERGFQAGSLILLSGILLRGLGDEVFAKWQYAMAVFSSFYAFTWIFGNEILLVELYKRNKSKLIIYFFSIRLIFCFFISISFVAYSYFFGDWFLLRFSLCVFFVLLIREPFSVFSALNQYVNNYNYVLLINIVTVSIRLLVIYALFKAERIVNWIGIAWLIEALSFCVGMYLGRSCKYKNIKFNIKVLIVFFHRYFKKSLKIWISICIGILFFKYDKIFLMDKIGSNAYSRYSASSQINENLVSVISISMNFIAPYYMYKYIEKKEGLVKLRNTLIGVFLFLFVISLVASIFQDFFGRFVFGSPEYTEKIRLISFMLPLYGVYQVLNFYFYKNHEYNHVIKKSLILISVLVLSSNLIVCFFEPQYSILMAMYLSILSAIAYDFIFFRGGKE